MCAPRAYGVADQVKKILGHQGAPRVTTVPTDLTAFSCVSHVIHDTLP
jgi:hypothetical protein